MPVTTKAHFVFFSEMVRCYQQKLGLSDWDIQIRHESIGTQLAQTNSDCEGCVATIALNKAWKPLDPIQDKRIKRLALHEVIHVLLADLYYIASCRYATQSELDIAEHKIVRRLENVLGDELV